MTDGRSERRNIFELFRIEVFIHVTFHDDRWLLSLQSRNFSFHDWLLEICARVYNIRIKYIIFVHLSSRDRPRDNKKKKKATHAAMKNKGFPSGNQKSALKRTRRTRDTCTRVVARRLAGLFFTTVIPATENRENRFRARNDIRISRGPSRRNPVTATQRSAGPRERCDFPTRHRYVVARRVRSAWCRRPPFAGDVRDPFGEIFANPTAQRKERVEGAGGGIEWENREFFSRPDFRLGRALDARPSRGPVSPQPPAAFVVRPAHAWESLGEFIHVTRVQHAMLITSYAHRIWHTLVRVYVRRASVV